MLSKRPKDLAKNECACLMKTIIWFKKNENVLNKQSGSYIKCFGMIGYSENVHNRMRVVKIISIRKKTKMETKWNRSFEGQWIFFLKLNQKIKAKRDNPYILEGNHSDWANCEKKMFD